MFSSLFLKSFRLLLFPFALVYWLIINIRNWLFNKNILKSSSFGMPLICIGNLSVGGTGKSPMVEYLLEHLKDKFRVATLSRGYKRKTKGYALANETSTALEIGDEPMQFHLKFPDVPVAVGEERMWAIPQLLHDRPGTQAIILDDAFQHRSIKAGLNILLTDYNNLFTRDFYLPTGDLRDLKSSYKRAEIIVVTKCDAALTAVERDKVIAEIGPLPGQSIYFTTLEYGPVYHLLDWHIRPINTETEVLLVSGIANPEPLQRMLETRCDSYSMLQYSDHHIFSIDDLNDIKKKFAGMQAENKMILTTEKDAVRLLKFRSQLNGMPLYVIPVRHKFLFEQADEFKGKATDFISNFKQQAIDYGKEKLEKEKR